MQTESIMIKGHWNVRKRIEKVLADYRMIKGVS